MTEAKEIEVTDYKTLECQLGKIEYQANSVIHFPGGLFGFEQYNDYLLWKLDKYLPFQWLICVNNPQFIFPVLDPKFAFPDFNPKLEREDQKSAQLVIVTIGENMDETTVNLRAPLLVSTDSRLGKQVILSDSDYPLRYPVQQ